MSRAIKLRLNDDALVVDIPVSAVMEVLAAAGERSLRGGVEQLVHSYRRQAAEYERIAASTEGARNAHARLSAQFRKLVIRDLEFLLDRSQEVRKEGE